MSATAELLARADGTAALPRLGGMARPNGVVIVSERFWAFAATDGSVREGEMLRPPELVQRLPLARGLVRLGASLSPLFRGRGVARRSERLLIFGALIAPVGLALLSGPWPTVAGIVVSLALTMELWRVVQASSHRFWRLFLLPGLALQRLTTREPRLDETRVALAA